MAIAHSFDYVKPATLAAAIRELARRRGRAQVLAGGTDLISLIADHVATPDILVDIKGIKGLDRIAFKGGVFSIGALATFSDLRESPAVGKKLPVLREMAGWVASYGIRNRATMVGNLCSAVPCCDSGAALMVYDTVILATGPKGKRRIPLDQWFAGPRRTVLNKNEIVTGVAVTLPRKQHGACFVKMRRYEGEDLAQASVTVLALADGAIRVSFGSVAPTPIRGRRIEVLLSGRPLTDDGICEAVGLLPLEISPITDIRSTKEYRLHMVGVMLERGLRAAVARRDGNGPAYGTSLI